ncbi:MAG: hypothetical protein Q3W83_05410 [Ruminococcus sp.]|nr:hypothetical protein [Ruminococcus sp.]MDR4077351.1 hypothetical protein [Ruminococcus sp.]
MHFLLLVISDSAMLSLSATGGGRKATPTVDCTNNHKTTLEHDLFCFWHYKTCLHERGTAVRRYCK